MPVVIDPADQLQLYNAALNLCRQTRLSALTDDIEARYILDDVWNRGNGAAQYCLEQGYWTFATASVALANDPGYSPAFGQQYRFFKPADWVRTVRIAADGFFRNLLRGVRDEGGVLYANQSPLYLRYISTGAAFGGNVAGWHETFRRWFEAYLGREAVGHLTTSAEIIADVRAWADRMLNEARLSAQLDLQASDAPPPWPMPMPPVPFPSNRPQPVPQQADNNS